MRWAFEETKLQLKSAKSGISAKTARWWSIEEEAREKRNVRPCEAFLLDFIGFKRKWFTGFGDAMFWSKRMCFRCNR